MAREPIETGTFLRIRLPDGSYAYGRALQSPYVAFYDFRTTEPMGDINAIEAKAVLFRLAARLEEWQDLGRKELRGEVAEPVVLFWQSEGDFLDCTIYDSVGNSRKATPEECIGIERSEVWEQHGVANRLCDAFAGRPNRDEVTSRVRLEPTRAEAYLAQLRKRNQQEPED